MKFEVIFADTAERAVDTAFEDAKSANDFAKKLAADTGRKVRIAKVVTQDWREREAKRLSDGTYRPLPDWWQEAPWWVGSVPSRDHFAHYASDNQRIAFTENAEKGAADRQLTMSVTSYLGRFFKDVLPPPQMNRIAVRFIKGDVKVHFSFAPEDFERVFSLQNVSAGGSSNLSCMRYSAAYQKLPHHPAYVYGAGDLQIAWIQDDFYSLDMGENKLRHNFPSAYCEYGGAFPEIYVTARAVVNPQNKKYTRIYGRDACSVDMLRNQLEILDYERDENAYEGCRILKVPLPCKGKDYFLMPYIDGNVRGVSNDSVFDNCFMLTASDADGYADNTGGYVYVENSNRIACAHCGRMFRERIMTDVRGNNAGLWCDDCIEENSFVCNFTGDIYNDENRVEVITARINIESWADIVARELGFWCQNTNTYYYRAFFNSITVNVSPGVTQVWCAERAADSYFRCERTNQYYFSGAFSPIQVKRSSRARRFQTWCEQATRNDREERNGVWVALNNGVTSDVEENELVAAE